MGDVRLENGWDRQIENGLPDCRLRYGEREQVMLGRLPMEKVFCANCGVAAGMATVWTPHVFFICDACFFKTGEQTPPGTIKLA